MNKRDLIKIRKSTNVDHNFILATMLRSLYYDESWFTLIPKHIFMTHYNKVINLLLSKFTTEVLVACLKDDEDTILGYSILSPGTVHFVYIKKAWRNLGLARDLVPEDCKNVTHLTKSGLSLLKKKDLIFNPFLI